MEIGGDHAPKEAVKGAVDAVKEYGISVVITGDETKITEELAKYDFDKSKIEVVELLK